MRRERLRHNKELRVEDQSELTRAFRMSPWLRRSRRGRREKNEREPVLLKDKETKKRIYFAFKIVKGTPSSALE